MSESKHNPKILLIGIGNNGRSDDGLGWAFAEALKKDNDFRGDITLRYQLQVDDAELISNYEKVIFVDAFTGELADGFAFKTVEPANDFSFSTHNVSPESILFLCEELYGVRPEAQIILIQGENWELKIGLGASALQHLDAAMRAFKKERVAP